MTTLEAISNLVEHKDLSIAEAYDVALEMMNGHLTQAQIGALLIALRLKGETIDEITGFVRAMRDKATRIVTRENDLVDTCGTGGDRSGTFNISTVSALVAAGAGCKVAKHGNRSISSRCGSADLLFELGINIELPHDRIGRCIDQNGFGFLFAPLLHKAMKHAIGPRKEIGVRTIFNILGPLTNPAGAKRQLLGVFDKKLTEPIARVLKNLGSEHVMVVHGEDGLDEITLTSRTLVTELKNGKIMNYTLIPEDFGLKKVGLKEILGGDPIQNAKIALDVLSGKKGSARDVTLLNAGAVIYVSGKASSIQEGIHAAVQSIDSGKAMKKLESLKQYTNR